MNKEIFPDTNIEEILINAKKKDMFFMKQYNKNDFVYFIEKRPFKKRSIIAIHIPTKTVFGYSEYFLKWNKINIEKEDVMKLNI